jgi:hypothetical protein
MNVREAVLVVFAAWAFGACEASKPLDACDGFFTQGCKAPLHCVNSGDKSLCLNECDTSFKCKDPHGCCDQGLQCKSLEMRVTKNGVDQGISAGHEPYCMPK